MEARALTDADLPRAAALSALIGWNQTEADWQAFRDAGQVQVVDDGDPAYLAATAAFIRYAGEAAWISMVLVRPDRRREGIATALMHWAMTAAREAGVRCVALDATPLGRPVYARSGFAAAFGFARWRLTAAIPDVPGVPVRRVGDGDWPALLALDARAFGAPRPALLRAFAARLPDAAWIAADGSGYVLGREGRLAPQIGPVVAADPETGLALIGGAQRALGGAAVIDLADAQMGLADIFRRTGAEMLRPFTRMTLGASLPGDPSLLIAVGGPEFG